MTKTVLGYEIVKKPMHRNIKTIHYIPHEPKACMECGRDDDLHKNAANVLTGTDKNSLTPKESMLCQACETLMIITTEQKAMMSIQPLPGDQITLKPKNP